MVGFRTGTRINIKRDTELLKRFFYQFMIPVYNILRSDTFFLSFNRNRYPVLIGATDKYHFFPLSPQIPYINIGRYIYSGQMADVYRPVGIR